MIRAYFEHQADSRSADADFDATLQQRLAELQAYLAANLKQGKAPTVRLGMDRDSPVLIITAFDPKTNEFTQYFADLTHSSAIIGTSPKENVIYARMRGGRALVRFFNAQEPHKLPGYMALFIDNDLDEYRNRKNSKGYKPFVPPEFKKP